MHAQAGTYSDLWLLVYLCVFVLYVCTQRLERCHRDLGAQTTNIRENEVYNHLSEKVWHMTRGSEMTSVSCVYLHVYTVQVEKSTKLPNPNATLTLPRLSILMLPYPTEPCSQALHPSAQ